MLFRSREWTPDDANAARARYQARNARLQARHDETAGPAARTLANKPVLAAPDPRDKQDRIAQALARARARRP